MHKCENDKWLVKYVAIMPFYVFLYHIDYTENIGMCIIVSINNTRLFRLKMISFESKVLKYLDFWHEIFYNKVEITAKRIDISYVLVYWCVMV